MNSFREPMATEEGKISFLQGQDTDRFVSHKWPMPNTHTRRQRETDLVGAIHTCVTLIIRVKLTNLRRMRGTLEELEKVKLWKLYK